MSSTTYKQSPIIILGLSGKARSGKSTIAQYLCHQIKQLYNINVIHRSIADVLKKECQVQYSLTPQQLFGNDKETQLDVPVMINNIECKTPRRILQVYGQWKREANPDYWIDQLIQALVPFQNLSCVSKQDLIVVIIDDIRFLNEFRKLKVLFTTKMIRIHRLHNIDGTVFVSNDTDSSETELDDCVLFDFHFINKGITLYHLKDCLYYQVGNIMASCWSSKEDVKQKSLS